MNTDRAVFELEFASLMYLRLRSIVLALKYRLGLYDF